MWKCCLPKKNDDNAIEQSEKGENEDIIYSNMQHKFYVDFKELVEGYDNNEGEYIDMNKPRHALYATDTDFLLDDKILETTRLGGGGNTSYFNSQTFRVRVIPS